jgi:hypothetical protein
MPRSLNREWRAIAAFTALAAGVAACGADETLPNNDFRASRTRNLSVHVQLDGTPIEGATVMQGGNPEQWTTTTEGVASVVLDLEIGAVGELALMASHPAARTRAVLVTGNPSNQPRLAIELERFDTTDNEAYEFQDPGEPSRRETTDQCAHCHVTINQAWFDSPHRSAAKNGVLHDVYSGTSARSTATECEAHGGRWRSGLAPGTGEPTSRCYLGDGVLPVLNPNCAAEDACDTAASQFGGCADCHAPGIDGKLGGRDLLAARGFAYDYGVHCDVCHRVESVELDREPGVAGRLHLLRPSEPSTNPLLGEWKPIMFGPRPDVPNPLMSGVAREHFNDGRICAGCHEYAQRVLVPSSAIDTQRWPGGRLPVHTTWSELKAGPFAEVACPSCHMPPEPGVGNGADLYNFIDPPEGIASGWRRPPGSVLKHAWYGPRQPESGMHKLAAALQITKRVLNGTVVAQVRVRNVGCGHAIPTGEPMRSMVLLVEAHCGTEKLMPTGGNAVPDFGGYLDSKLKGEDWTRWPGAKAGEIVRVVRRPGGFLDYEGYGPFGDGTFDAVAKGMPIEEVVGESRITSVSADMPSFDAPLPAGDVAYRVDGAGLPANGAAGSAWAGAPGFGFARVMTAADGRRMVPHFLAADIASDNRILPQQSVTTEHRFATMCANPSIVAVLLHRAYPLELARERGWKLIEQVIADGKR